MVLHVPVSMEKERDQYVVICPVFHVASQGRTEKEALANIVEALELFLEDEDVQKEFADVIKQYTVTEPSMMDLVKVEINDNRKITHLVGA